MRIAWSGMFRDAWSKLTSEEKRLARRAMDKLVLDIRYPSLRVKKVQGAEDIWEARVSRSIRLTFEIVGAVIVFRNVGQHDETLKNP